LIKIFKIEGHSLYPYLKTGQRIVCFKVFKLSKINTGDFVIFSKKPYGLMIKRVEKIKDGRFYVQGTDPMSIDSRTFGFIERSDIKYKKYAFS